MYEVMVSIVCLTYNHENYIDEAIKGFLSQRCGFKIEAIIHDDASTDRTPDIIKKYADEQSSIIKPIFQSENQYSKRTPIIQTYVVPKIKGKYISLCEGDDYWIDPYKLQKQVDYMEAHPDCSFCFTNANVLDMTTAKFRQFIPFSDKDREYYSQQLRDFTLNDFYKFSFIPTASYLFKTDDYFKMLKTCKKVCPAGDLRMRLFLTSLGYAHFIDDITCVYRMNVPGSAMTTWKKDNRKRSFERARAIYEMIEEIDGLTNHRYYEGLYPFIKIHAGGMIGNMKGFSLLKKEPFKRVYSEQDFKRKVKTIVKCILPDALVDH